MKSHQRSGRTRTTAASEELAALRRVQAVIEMDAEGTVLATNELLQQLLGYSSEQIQGGPFAALLDPSLRDSAELAEFWRRLTAGDAGVAVHRFRNKDGAAVFLRGVYVPVAKAGAVAKIVMYAQDVTAQRTEAAIQTSTMAGIDRVRAIAEFDLSGTVLRVNGNFERLFGYSLAELQGRNHSVLVPPEQRSASDYRALWEQIRAGQFQAGEYLCVNKHGKVVWIQGYFSPICDLDGKPFRVVLYATDVTQQKQIALDALRVKAALDNTGANCMLADADNKIVYLNRSLQRMFERLAPELRRHLPNFDPASLLGRNMDEFHRNPAHQRQLVAALQSTHDNRVAVDAIQLRIIADPVLDANGVRVGTVVEWVDRTQESRIEGEVGEIVVAAQKGDLTKRVSLRDKQGFFKTLGTGINGLVDNMQQLVGEIQAAAGAVQASAVEIADGNQNLARRTERTAASLEETASSMEQMTASVKQTADNAGQANQLAMAARQQAEKGGTVVGTAVAAMNGINDASKKIADIIGVIDEIAFQTNLLALNAAVEAARAGEQGRGFAVVATEVRNLAGRSAAAAKEIKGLIKDSVAKVEEGSRLVDASGKTLAEIVGSVKKVTDIVAEIAAASREQSSGIEQVNKAVMEMDGTTQQNAALVQQAASASDAIVEHARSLNAVIARYEIGQEPAPGATERRAPGRPWTAVPAPNKPAQPEPAQPKSVQPKSAQAKPAPVQPRATATPVKAAVAKAGAARAADRSDSDWQEF